MYKNRYFKTTFGVPTELVFGGNTLPTGVTNQGTIDFAALTGVAGVIYPVRIMPNLKDRRVLQNSTGWNNFTTGAIAAGTTPNINVDSQAIQFASCVTAGTVLTGSFQMSTPLLAKSIRIIGSKSYTAAAAQVSTLLLNGTYTVGHTAVFKVIETTPGNQNLPVWDYEVHITTGTTAANLATDFNNKFGTGSTTPTSASTVMNTTKSDEWFYFTISSATITVTAAAGAAGRSFKLSLTVQTSSAAPTASAWTTPTYTLSTAPSWGSGTPDQIANLIQEDATRRGVGHYYPTQNATASEFGTPDATISALIASSPSVLTLQGLKYENSPTPVEQHVNPNHYITIVCGSTVATSLLLQFPTL